MELDIALDELYATGWSALDTTGCAHHRDGRSYPALARVEREFRESGFELKVSRVERFNCYRAEWSEVGGAESGSVVGHSEAAAAVYALAQFRRQLVAPGA